MQQSNWSKLGYWVAIIISSASTFMFGYRYAPQLFPSDWVGTGFLHDIIVGLMSTALFDFMAYVWYSVLHAPDQKTPAQIGIAKIMMWFSVMFSTLLSLAWFTLNMEIVPSQVLVVTAQWLGVIAFTVGPTVQFIAWSAYVMKSMVAVQRVVAAEENALDAAMAFKVLQERRNAMRQGEATAIADLMLSEWQRLRGYDNKSHGVPGASDVVTASLPVKEDKPNGGVVPNPIKRGPGRPPKQPAP